MTLVQIHYLLKMPKLKTRSLRERTTCDFANNKLVLAGYSSSNCIHHYIYISIIGRNDLGL